MTKTLSILLALGFFLVLLASPAIPATAERGQEPQCQEQCLANHIKAMQKLSDELAKTGKVMAYQDLVGLEVSNYSARITNCRVITPVK